jgi:hypothetical protein
VNVLGHEYISHHGESSLAVGGIEACGQTSPPVVVGEEWQAMVARKCKLMEMTVFVIMSHGLAVEHLSISTISVSPALA